MRIVIVPPYPQMVAEWSHVALGDVLPMYEGPRVCGHGRVLWRRNTRLPVPDRDEERFRVWVLNPTTRPSRTDPALRDARSCRVEGGYARPDLPR